jgi:hypothetical protein
MRDRGSQQRGGGGGIHSRLGPKQAGLEKKPGFKKNSPVGFFVFFGFFCFFFVFLYIFPEERVLRVFSVTRLLLCIQA